VAVTTIAFFNNKGGVGKTSLVYHIAWMFCDLGVSVVAADLDPQANLTAAFLEEDALEELIESDNSLPTTIFRSIEPLKRGVGDVVEPIIQKIEDNLILIPGDLQLSSFEDQLSENWPKCLDSDERAFRVMSALWRVLQKAASTQEADVILMDLGPNLGAINRAAFIAADYVVVPLAPDIFSIQGLRNLGPALRRWRGGWEERLRKSFAEDLRLPTGSMRPIGYIVLQYSVRWDRPARAYGRWISEAPRVYRQEVLNESVKNTLSTAQDIHCLALLKNYQSLMPMAQAAHKPMFHLKPADGAIGSHSYAAHNTYGDFKPLALKIANLAGIKIPANINSP